MGNSQPSQQEPQTCTPPVETKTPLVQDLQEPVQEQHYGLNIFQDPNQAGLRLNKRGSTEMPACAGKVVRQLPPLKKNRSHKKMDQGLEARRCLATNQNLLNAQNTPQKYAKSEAETTTKNLKVEEIYEEQDKNILNENVFRQTRSKKMRLTKQIQNKLGGYF